MTLDAYNNKCRYVQLKKPKRETENVHLVHGAKLVLKQITKCYLSLKISIWRSQSFEKSLTTEGVNACQK